MSRYLSFIIINLFFLCDIIAQGVYVPNSFEYYQLIQRYEIKSGRNLTSIHTSFQPYRRIDVANSFRDDSLFESPADKFNYQYLMNDSHEWTDREEDPAKPFLKYFYQKKANAYYLKDSSFFEIHADPILDLYGGMDYSNSSIDNDIEPDSGFTSSSDRSVYRNTRGVTVRGLIDNKIGFQTTLLENQVRYPFYVDTRISEDGVVPGQGFYKRFGANGWDFFTATGYVTFNATKHVSFQFGHDRNFIGNGYRSMILSDFSNPYLFLKAETQVWKFKYTNLFAQLTTSRSGIPYPRKYMALHHLSINIGKKLNVGLFESVIYGREDQGLDIAYLNPIIFYRAIEQNNGSADNALLGMDFKYIPIKKLSFYGQLIFDEVVVSNLRAGNGWWANKFGIQGGMKYIDAFGVNNLDIQLEGNLARPFTYTHLSDFTNYQHFQQPLAHPMGANFHEAIANIRYQPVPKLTMNLRQVFIMQGRDIYYRDTVINYGQNIRIPYNSRVREFGNEIGQGAESQISITNLRFTYMLKHNLFIDFNYAYRRSNYQPNRSSSRYRSIDNIDWYSTININDDSHILGLGLRWNAFLRHLDF